jgi:endonuclease G
VTGPHAEYDEQFVKELEAARAQPRGTLDLAANRAPNEKADPATAVGARIEHMTSSGAGFSSRDFERTIGLNDLVPVNYLERGLMAARTVCRIGISPPFGDSIEWGTGFLVTPRLLLTNNHVFRSADEALRSTAEFGYERDAAGNLRESRRFVFQPDQAFITDVDLDFTLVAVAPSPADGTASLAEFGFARLNPQIHKVEPGEFVSVIQHPRGDEKYAAVRENEVIKIGDDQPAHDNWLWYYSDTAPGSSGAPVFNDSWQVVAIHHRGVPVERTQNGTVEWQLTTGEWLAENFAALLPEDKVKWVANEGVRISRIIDKITELHNAGPVQSPLVQDFLDDVNGIRSLTGSPGRESIVGPQIIVFGGAPAGPRLV